MEHGAARAFAPRTQRTTDHLHAFRVESEKALQSSQSILHNSLSSLPILQLKKDLTFTILLSFEQFSTPDGPQVLPVTVRRPDRSSHFLVDFGKRQAVPPPSPPRRLLSARSPSCARRKASGLTELLLLVTTVRRRHGVRGNAAVLFGGSCVQDVLGRRDAGNGQIPPELLLLLLLLLVSVLLVLKSLLLLLESLLRIVISLLLLLLLLLLRRLRTCLVMLLLLLPVGVLR